VGVRRSRDLPIASQPLFGRLLGGACARSRRLALVLIIFPAVFVIAVQSSQGLTHDRVKRASGASTRILKV